MEMQDRRQTLKQGALVASLLAGAGLMPQLAQAADGRPAFDAKTVAEGIKALGGATLTQSDDISLKAPDIAENGAVVPLGISTSLPGVKQLVILVEKNPSALTAVFNVSDRVEADFSTRVKMGQSSDVYAVAIMNDGKTLYTKKEVKVTLGGCGG
jgi:sulfur-oxidizing protein SoxY